MADEDDRVGRRADDEHLGVLAHRITALEKRVDTGLASIDHKLDTLSFVRSDVYAAQQAHADQIHKSLQADIDDTRRLALWALSAIGVSLLGAIVAGIARLAGL